MQYLVCIHIFGNPISRILREIRTVTLLKIQKQVLHVNIVSGQQTVMIYNSHLYLCVTKKNIFEKVTKIFFILGSTASC